jgi:ketosteroid isomerase-like protein
MTLERASWEALSIDGGAERFYAEHLAPDVVMLLPGGLVLLGREQTLRAMSGPPWQSYRLEDVQDTRITDDVHLVRSAAVAAREGQPTYSALMASLWVRRPDGWRLVFHQQTPRS